MKTIEKEIKMKNENLRIMWLFGILVSTGCIYAVVVLTSQRRDEPKQREPQYIEPQVKARVAENQAEGYRKIGAKLCAETIAVGDASVLRTEADVTQFAEMVWGNRLNPEVAEKNGMDIVAAREGRIDHAVFVAEFTKGWIQCINDYKRRTRPLW